MELDESLKERNENLEKQYEEKSIYILNYPKGYLIFSSGAIQNLEAEKIIYHKYRAEDGSSSSPILSKETFKVIWIH